MAQQAVSTYQGTTTESLTFIHQDASGASAQQTLADGTLLNSGIRAGEYDALGRNVADAGPYITLDTDLAPTESSGSNVDLFGSGQGYRPGQTIYAIDGQVVPQSTFFEAINSGAVGGALRLLETTARLSARFAGYSLRFGNGDTQFAGNDLNTAIGQMEGGETLVRNWFVSDGWAVSGLIAGGDDNYNPRFIQRLEGEEGVVKRILDIAYFARDSKECADAFKAVGATPVSEQIKNTTIVTEGVFNDGRHDSAWTDGSDIGQQMRDSFTSSTNNLSWPGLYKDTGRRFIGLTNRAIEGKDDHLSVVIIHSFVHSGGIAGQDISTWWQRNISGNVPHDLKFLGEKYKDILKHCTRERTSKALYGQ